MLCSNTVTKPIPLNNLCHPNHILNSFCMPSVRSAVNFVCQNVLPFGCLYVSWSICQIVYWRLVYIRLSVCQAVRWRSCMSDWPLPLLCLRLSVWQTDHWSCCIFVCRYDILSFGLDVCPLTVCLSSIFRAVRLSVCQAIYIRVAVCPLSM